MTRLFALRLFFSGIFLIPVSFVIEPNFEAHALTRSCHAHYEITPNISGASRIVSGVFSAEGKGGFPKAAKRRAERNLLQCMRAHFANRFIGALPGACTRNSGITRYRNVHYNRYLKYQLCTAYPGRRTISITVRWVYERGTHCLVLNNAWAPQYLGRMLIECTGVVPPLE